MSVKASSALKQKKYSTKGIGRLSLYRRVLQDLHEKNLEYIHSYEIAQRTHLNASQVRRDLMMVDFLGNPQNGYEITKLLNRLDSFFNAQKSIRTVLFGVGELGRTLIRFCQERRSSYIRIEAAFDVDPHKTQRVISGVRVYPLDELENIVQKENIKVVILAVPEKEAQTLVNRLLKCGVKSFVNLTLAPLKVPEHVYVEHIDISVSLEKAAFFGKEM